MIGLLYLMFWTIFARLFIVKAGFDSFGTSLRLELECYVIQLSHTIFFYFLIILVFVLF
jgi:hypothetical protein